MTDPITRSPDHSITRFPVLNAIVDVDVAERAGWTPLDLASAYLNGGARFLQVRAKSLAGGAFLDLATRIVELGRDAGAIVVVNDRADVARLSHADGVHVGQEDLSPAAARAIVGPDGVVGLSTHTEAQIDGALDQPISYLAVGPIFGTSTKATRFDAVGLERVSYAAGKVRLKADPTTVTHVGSGRTVDVGSAFRRTVDIVAIGGITLDNIADVIQAGATSAAVISDLLATGDPEARVRAYLERVRQGAKV